MNHAGYIGLVTVCLMRLLLMGHKVFKKILCRLADGTLAKSSQNLAPFAALNAANKNSYFR